MLVAQPDFQLLASILVLVWPLRVVLPEVEGQHLALHLHVKSASYFKISLCRMMRLISSIIAELTHTISGSDRLVSHRRVSLLALTLFADQGVISVVRVVGVSHSGAAAIGNSSEVKF